MRKGIHARPEACQTAARPPAPAGAPEDRRSATPGGAERQREPAILRAEWTRGVPPILIYKAVAYYVIAHTAVRFETCDQRSAFPRHRTPSRPAARRVCPCMLHVGRRRPLSLSLSPFAARCERPSALERLLWLILVHHLLHLLELIIHCRGQHTLGRLECRELVVDAAAGLERFKLVVERRAFACGRARR